MLKNSYPISAVVSLISLALLSGCATRTAAIDVGNDTALIYAMQWGWSMHDCIYIIKDNKLIAEKCDEVYDRVRNSGGSLFANEERSVYYISFTIGVNRIDLLKGKIEGFCDLDGNIAQNLEYIGYFGLTEFNYKEKPRGDNVTFTPKGQSPPVLRYGRAPGRIDELKDRCG